MPPRPKTPMEKYKAGLPLTASEKMVVNRILERNRLKKTTPSIILIWAIKGF